ncbi:hypothetical protein CS0771_11970 [Catellatospora sp. IY07-71]|uniref:hypothetical protein n=1 Tax=Catellatospora sp. IY07-71 TaxID=2728827 RepID=UPI001BB3EA72|nr:hypothetical protein [Catellatospora sp. IY07-71]BCJ71653.1 hypothetical protein CS0771_11970 [Catellatospora sp. IY07-71]
MIPLSMRVPVESGYVFPAGAMCLSVEPAKDFKLRGHDDDQMRDENGVRVWHVKVLDLDPEAGKFGRSKEVRVKVSAPHQPVPPSPTVPGYPPLVQFEGLTLTPWVDQQKCKSSGQCRAQLSWSLRATGMVAAAASPAMAGL